MLNCRSPETARAGMRDHRNPLQEQAQRLPVNRGDYLRGHPGKANQRTVAVRVSTTSDFIARPVLIENSTGQPASRIDFSGAGSFSVSDLEPSLYVQDHWLLRPNLALDLGTRWETQTITRTVRIAPRAGFVWTPDQSQTTVIRGGIGVFYDGVPLNTYAFSSYPQQTVTMYNSTGGVIGRPIQYINPTQQAAESRFPFIDSAQKSGNFAPYTVGWNVELDHSFSHLIMARLKYLQGQAHNMLTIQPEVVQNQPALVLGSTGVAQTRQLEFTARFGGQEKRQIFFSYVSQFARGTVNDANTYLGNLPFPIMNPNFVASLPRDSESLSAVGDVQFAQEIPPDAKDRGSKWISLSTHKLTAAVHYFHSRGPASLPTIFLI
jgi:TonB dependent receptor